jgi:hypothetical protein
VELLRQSLERARILSMYVLEILDAYEQRYKDRWVVAPGPGPGDLRRLVTNSDPEKCLKNRRSRTTVKEE